MNGLDPKRLQSGPLDIYQINPNKWGVTIVSFICNVWSTDKKTNDWRWNRKYDYIYTAEINR